MPNVNYRGKLPSQDPKTHTDLTGFTAAPNHYSQHGRETIDKARDMKTDAEFAAFCDLTAFIYRDRAPYKGAEEQDIAKAVWYEAMADHVRHPSYWEDPRSKRPDFVPYRRQPAEIPIRQDPNAPPESGMTSIPLGAPWPPLSREQVVELHQELVEFYAGMRRCVDLGINDSAKAAYAERLTIVLHRLGIGSPPPTRTWTHEEVAKVAEEVQQRSGLPRHAEGRAPTTATELAITAALESSQSLSREQVEELLQSTADVPRRQEGRWEEPPKRNCYTCRWHPKDGCEVKPFTKEVIHWLRDADRDQPHGLMLPTADGCPGWEPKS